MPSQTNTTNGKFTVGETINELARTNRSGTGPRRALDRFSPPGGRLGEPTEKGATEDGVSMWHPKSKMIPNVVESRIAHDVKVACERDLGLVDSVPLVWIDMEHCQHVFGNRYLFGFAVGGEIFVRAGLGVQDLVETISHEIRHIWQFVTNQTWSEAVREGDAEAYGHQVWLACTEAVLARDLSEYR